MGVRGAAIREKGAGGGVGTQAGSGARDSESGTDGIECGGARCCPGRSAVLVALLSESLCCPSPAVSKRGRGIQAGWAGS